jgi:hypothetical protein
MSDRIEIRPASVAQVIRSRRGVRVVITDDVCDVARRVEEINPEFRLEYDPLEAFFVVYQRRELPTGEVKEQLVATALDCDARLVEEVRKAASPSYDLAGEMERLDARAERDRRHRFSEQIGDAGERLAHALCNDLDLNGSRIFVPGGKAG